MRNTLLIYLSIFFMPVLFTACSTDKIDVLPAEKERVSASEPEKASLKVVPRTPSFSFLFSVEAEGLKLETDALIQLLSKRLIDLSEPVEPGTDKEECKVQVLLKIKTEYLSSGLNYYARCSADFSGVFDSAGKTSEPFEADSLKGAWRMSSINQENAQLQSFEALQDQINDAFLKDFLEKTARAYKTRSNT